MRIPDKEILDGTYNDRKLWVCDYRIDDPSNKAIRNQKPTQTLLKVDLKVPSYWNNRRANFHPIDKEGNPQLSKTINMYDQTRSPHSLHVFEDEEECKECYRELMRQGIRKIEGHVAYQLQRIEAIKNDIAKV